MTPDSHPTPEERAKELDKASAIATAESDFVFARELAKRAQQFCEQDIKEIHNGLQHSI